MKMNNQKALILTFFCALLILTAGYLGISQGGKLLLHNESAPEQAAYENTSSNIFYGKIEDDIALYPWNHYSEEGLTGYPQFGMFYIENPLEMETIFYGLIQQNTGIAYEQVETYYSTNRIVENLKTGEDDRGLQYYFFEDILEAGHKKYQVKIACDNWNILSVFCNEVRPEETQNTEEWKQGKEILTKVLEENQEKLAAQMDTMLELNSSYLETGDYIKLNLILTETLNSILSGNAEEYWSKIDEKTAYWEKVMGQSTGNEAITGYKSAAAGFSYQILERSDIILLLLQSDSFNIGLYYDPVAVKFCGYNFL